MNDEQQGEDFVAERDPADAVPEIRDEGGRDGRHAQSGPNSGGAGWISSILANILCGIRLAALRRVSPDELAASPGAFAALALFDFLLHLALSLVRVGTEGYFSLQYFSYGLVHIPLMLFAGLWIGRLGRRSDLALPLSTAFLATGIPIALMAELLNTIPEIDRLGDGWLTPDFDHFYPFFGWWALASMLAVIRMSAMPRLRRLGALAAFGVTLLIPLWSIPRGELWNEAYDDSASKEVSQADIEEAIYSQPELLESALERIRPGRRGIEDLYFIGFAGYASQDVFRKELEVIAGIMRNRFDTAGRSLLLVNNPGTLLQYPLASATSLEMGLDRMARVMDKDEDILLLYLTSHGSEEHRLAAELAPLAFRDIDPAMLKEMLDESGIHWKVIVVSACYSGAYIDALKDDSTLVMTASDSTSSSFGCSSDSDFTWFGKALFDEELRKTFSFTSAFSRASQSIAEREAKEGEDPSHPQIFVGKEIAPRLKRLEERLEELKRSRDGLRHENLDVSSIASHNESP